MFKFTLKIFTYLVILLIIGFLVKPLPELTNIEPKSLPWQLSVGHAQVHVDDFGSGQILMQINKVTLTEVTPQMLFWFYQRLPYSTVQINQQKMTWFELLHPIENGAIDVLTALSSKVMNNSKGTLIKKEQWFGSYGRKTEERTLELTEQSMIIGYELAGQEFGRSYHSFIKTKKGVEYTVKTLIGSDLPVLGTIINFMLRYKIYPQNMLIDWGRHQAEELNNLNVILPLLYNAEKQQTDYIIKPQKKIKQ